MPMATSSLRPHLLPAIVMNLRRHMLPPAFLFFGACVARAAAFAAKSRSHEVLAGEMPTCISSRRDLLTTSVLIAASAASSLLLGPVATHAKTTNQAAENFRTGAFGREEYTNSIVASRDTNVSPKEVYDTIQSQYITYPLDRLKEDEIQRPARALDLGAGAGVSTQVLWEMGFREIDAVDWSGKAWERFVLEDDIGQCPESVRFFELDDERYLDAWRDQGSKPFDTIVFNFGINEKKAKQFAKTLLEPKNGRLLAPVNVQNDYWLKQAYAVYDGTGDVIKVIGGDIGAWSVQFQPDVTQDTCQGIWCAQFNGFQKKR